MKESTKKKLSEYMSKKWQDQEFRKKIIKKQEDLGYRLK